MSRPDQLIALDFLVQRITGARLPAKRHLGVRFHLLDFPPVLLNLPPRSPKLASSPRRSLQSSKENEEFHLGVSEARDFTVKRGKSCTFEMSPLVLATSLKRSPMLVELLDLDGTSADRLAASSPGVLGHGSIDLADIALTFEHSLQSSLPRTDCTGKAAIEIMANHSSRETVAVLHVRLRLALAVNRVTREKHQSDHSANPSHCTAGPSTPSPCSSRRCRLAVEREEKPHTCSPWCETVEPESPLCTVDGANGQHPSLSEAPPAPHGDHACLRSADLQPSAHVAELICEPSQPEESTGPKESVRYLPNTVCPPPLFYESRPRAPTNVAKNCPNKLGCEAVGKLESPGGGDSATSHWSALMAHDHCNRPISTRGPAAVGSGDPKLRSDTPSCRDQVPPHAPLPLLTALLDEFSQLKSCIESAADRRTVVERAASRRCDVEMLSKAAQTEGLCSAPPMPAQRPVQRSPQRPVQRSPQPPPLDVKRARTNKCLPANRSQTQHSHSRIFARECCRAVDPNAGRVPKNKSVIYPPDIASRKRRLNVRRRNHRVHNSSQTSKEADRRDEPSTTLLSAGGCFDPARRMLEVFIPQAPVATPVSTTPLSGSCTSLIHGSPTARVAAGKSVGLGKHSDVAVQGYDEPHAALRSQLDSSGSFSPERVEPGTDSPPGDGTASSTQVRCAAATLRVSDHPASDEDLHEALQAAVSELEAEGAKCTEVSSDKSALTVTESSLYLETSAGRAQSPSQQAAAAAAMESSTDDMEQQTQSGYSRHSTSPTGLVGRLSEVPAHSEASCGSVASLASTHENTVATSSPEQPSRDPSPLPSVCTDAVESPPPSPGDDSYSMDYSDDFESATESA